MMQLSENPPAIFPEREQFDSIGGQRWWVAHTKARFEKAFAFDLLARRIPYFLPLARRTFLSGGKKRQTLIPLFASYVFFAGGADERYAALRTGRLAQVIEVVDQQRLTRELSSLHRAIAADMPLAAGPILHSGQRCRIIAGAFEGIEGTVIRGDGSSMPRILLEVTLLGQGASMEIDAHLLEPLDEPAMQI